MTYDISGRRVAMISAMNSSVSRQAVPLPRAMTLRPCFLANSSNFALASARLSTGGAAGSLVGATGAGADASTGAAVVAASLPDVGAAGAAVSPGRAAAVGSTTGAISGMGVVLAAI